MVVSRGVTDVLSSNMSMFLVFPDVIPEPKVSYPVLYVGLSVVNVASYISSPVV